MMHVVGLFDRALGFGVAAETAGFGMFSQDGVNLVCTMRYVI